MKLGIITDVHNNIEALKTIIQKFKEENCDEILCAGDIIGLGPCPEETVQFVMNLSNFIAVKGNHERYLVEEMPNIYPNDERMSYEEIEHHKWEHGKLSNKSKEYLFSLPYELILTINNKKITILHYSMNEKYKCVNYISSPKGEDLEKMFKNINSDIIIYGHDHKRCITNYNGKLYINVGSLGCPSKDKNIARAGILILDDEIKVQLIDLEYNVKKVVNKIDELNYPSKDEIKKYFYGID